MPKTQRNPFPHGIDITAPGGLDALFAFNRARFGDARMEAGEGGDGGTGGDSGAGAGGTGGDSGAGAGGTDGAGTSGTGGTDAGRGGNQGKDGADGKPAEWDGKVESLPAGVQDLIKGLRKESGDERVATKTLAAIQKALDPNSGENKPDPEKLTQQLTEREAVARQAQLELAVYKTATANGGDPAALLDSRAFLAKIADIDPTKTGDIGAAIKAMVTDNPKLALAASKGGADFSGGTGEQRNNAQPKSLADAVKGHYGT